MTKSASQKDYAADGIWRLSKDTQRLNVRVVLGRSSLTFTNHLGQALAHWSIPAIQRDNPGIVPARYHPIGDPDEVLELSDDAFDLINELDRLHRAFDRSRRGVGFIRWMAFALLCAGLGYLAIVWFPKAAMDHVARVLPDVARRDLGQEVVHGMERLTGPACSDPSGKQGAAALVQRFTPAVFQITVLPDGFDTIRALPGHHYVISNHLLARLADPDALGGYVLIEAARAAHNDPLRAALEKMGLWHSLSLLVRGELPDEAINDVALGLLNSEQSGSIPQQTQNIFQQMRLSPDALLDDLETTKGVQNSVNIANLQIIKNGAFQIPSAATLPALSDNDWLRLQTICAR